MHEQFNKPVVSVYVPCHNAGKTLKRCVESIMEQTYGNLEILLIDNLSSDDTASIIDELTIRDARIKKCSCDRRGLAATRNYAVTVCNGEWVVPVDADDAIASDAVEVLLEAALDSNVDIVCASYYLCNEDELKKKKRIRLKEFESDDKEKLHDYFLEEGRNFNHAWGKIYKRNVLEKIVYPDGRLYEDLAVFPNMIEAASGIKIIDRPIYYYVLASVSISSSEVLSRQKDGLDFRLRNCEYYNKYYPELLPDACDAAVEFAFFLLGKISAAGIKKNETLWNEVVDITRKLIKKSARKGTAMKVAIMLFKLSPPMAGWVFSLYSREKNKIR